MIAGAQNLTQRSWALSYYVRCLHLKTAYPSTLEDYQGKVRVCEPYTGYTKPFIRPLLEVMIKIRVKGMCNMLCTTPKLSGFGV